jgi:hypothetical protein
MGFMNFSRLILIILALACVLMCPLPARKLQLLSYQELLEKSELVVIAAPVTKTTDTAEQSFLPNIAVQDADGSSTKIPSIGVETTFKVSAVLKGDKSIERFVLHHYREVSDRNSFNGASLVSFSPSTSTKGYLMFLLREQDGRYAPTGGQTDPRLQAVFELPSTGLNRGR